MPSEAELEDMCTYNIDEDDPSHSFEYDLKLAETTAVSPS